MIFGLEEFIGAVIKGNITLINMAIDCTYQRTLSLGL